MSHQLVRSETGAHYRFSQRLPGLGDRFACVAPSGSIRSPDQDIASTLLKFPDVARPSVVQTEILLDPLDYLCRQRFRMFDTVREHSPCDEPNQSQQIFGCFSELVTKRRGDDDVRTKPVVKVFSKRPVVHCFGQIAVGRGNKLAAKVSWFVRFTDSKEFS